MSRTVSTGSMTGFRGTDDTGQVVEDLTPAEMRVLLQQCTRYVVVDNPGWEPELSARALRLPETPAWRVEVRNGPDRHVATDAPNLDAAYDILRSWAGGDGWWQEAFSWTALRT